MAPHANTAKGTRGETPVLGYFCQRPTGRHGSCENASPETDARGPSRHAGSANGPETPIPLKAI